MSDLLISSSLLLHAEKGLMMAKTVIENLDKKLLEQSEKIQELESELKKRDELLREAVAQLKNSNESARFFSRHADCRKDSWACKCEFCRDTESSRNLRLVEEFLNKPEIKAILKGGGSNG